VEVLGDTADGVTTLDGEDSLCRRVVEHLIHLVVTNNPVTVKSLTRTLVKAYLAEFYHSGFSSCTDGPFVFRVGKDMLTSLYIDDVKEQFEANYGSA
jgi:hypothetical protein